MEGSKKLYGAVDCPCWNAVFCRLKYNVKMRVHVTPAVLTNRRGLGLRKASSQFDCVGLSLPPLATQECVLEKSLEVMFQTEVLTCLNGYDAYCCL